jgi:hypothetical protein
VCGGLVLSVRWREVAVLILVKWSWPLSGTVALVAGGVAFSRSVVDLPLVVGSVWLARVAASSMVAAMRVFVGFILGNNVALARGDVWFVALSMVVDGGCCGIVSQGGVDVWSLLWSCLVRLHR